MTHSRMIFPGRGPHRVSGFGLVELMVSLVLGLLLTGAAISVFISNRQTYRATESLGRVQENARVAFELMARDVREAAGNPCAKNLPIANVLKNQAANWWSNWGDGVVGVDGAFAQGEPANRVANTDAVELKSGTSNGSTVVDHQVTSAQFKLNTVNHDLHDAEIVMVCDYRQAAIVQVTGAQPGINETIVHNPGSPVSPGNCTKGLGVPADCNGPPLGTPYQYGPNSTIVKLHAVRWYVGVNGSGVNALYRDTLRLVGGTPSIVQEEIAEGVRDLQITYLLPGGNTYVDAGAVGGRWGEVLAARIDVLLEGQENVGTDGAPLERRLVHVATLRNRNS